VGGVGWCQGKIAPPSFVFGSRSLLSLHFVTFFHISAQRERGTCRAPWEETWRAAGAGSLSAPRAVGVASGAEVERRSGGGTTWWAWPSALWGGGPGAWLHSWRGFVTEGRGGLGAWLRDGRGLGRHGGVVTRWAWLRSSGESLGA
jgi:hypothetical protein